MNESFNVIQPNDGNVSLERLNKALLLDPKSIHSSFRPTSVQDLNTLQPLIYLREQGAGSRGRGEWIGKRVC